MQKLMVDGREMDEARALDKNGMRAIAKNADGQLIFVRRTGFKNTWSVDETPLSNEDREMLANIDKHDTPIPPTEQAPKTDGAT